MFSLSTKIAITAVAVSAAFSTETPARCRAGERPCAVIEIDERGQTWINGSLRGIDAALVEECTNQPHDAAVLVPDFASSVSDVADIWAWLTFEGVPVHFLTLGLRKELEQLFGLDPMRMCSAVSQRPYVEIPDLDQFAGIKTRIIAGESLGESALLRVGPSTPFGLDDLAAAEEDAFLRAGVLVVIDSRDRTRVLVLHGEHTFLAPPPLLDHETDGRNCFWPRVPAGVEGP